MIDTANTHWTLDYLIGVPLGILILLVGIGLLATLFFSDDGSAAFAGFWITLIGVVVLLASLFPFSTKYHKWYPVSGSVEKVGHRLISVGDKGGMAERYVLTIDGQPFGVDDTRAASVEVGDNVNLNCTLDWQFQAKAGWVCRWGG